MHAILDSYQPVTTKWGTQLLTAGSAKNVMVNCAESYLSDTGQGQDS